MARIIRKEREVTETYCEIVPDDCEKKKIMEGVDVVIQHVRSDTERRLASNDFGLEDTYGRGEPILIADRILEMGKVGTIDMPNFEVRCEVKMRATKQVHFNEEGGDKNA